VLRLLDIHDGMLWANMCYFDIVVQDISRVAAVVQLVVKEGDTIYGALICGSCSDF
jgi:hypothetical protein